MLVFAQKDLIVEVLAVSAFFLALFEPLGEYTPIAEFVFTLSDGIDVNLLRADDALLVLRIGLFAIYVLDLLLLVSHFKIIIHKCV